MALMRFHPLGGNCDGKPKRNNPCLELARAAFGVPRHGFGSPICEIARGVAENFVNNAVAFAGIHIRKPKAIKCCPPSSHHVKPSGGNKHKQGTIKMATGNHVAISNPEIHSWKCGTKSDLVTIHPNGKLGYEYNIVAREMADTIMQHVPCQSGGGCYTRYNIIKIEKIINGCLWKRYRNRLKDVAQEAGFANERMLFHGTKAANIAEIITHGFDERHSNINGMFGAGIYFAKHSSKSNQYAFGFMGGTGCPRHNNKSCFVCPRQLLFCRVILGKQVKYQTPVKLANPPVGYHSVLGEPSPNGLKFPEYIVYRGEQVYPEFLVTYTIA